MDSYRVLTLPRAEADARAAYRWLAAQSPAAARRWYRQLRQAIESLANHPGRCPLAPENEYFEEEIRHLLYGRRGGVYRILFTIREETVLVLAVRHGAHEPLRAEEIEVEEDAN